MPILEKIRLSDTEVEMLESGSSVMSSASWEKFEEFLAETDYLVDYNNG